MSYIEGFVIPIASDRKAASYVQRVDKPRRFHPRTRPAVVTTRDDTLHSRNAASAARRCFLH